MAGRILLRRAAEKAQHFEHEFKGELPLHELCELVSECVTRNEDKYKYKERQKRPYEHFPENVALDSVQDSEN